MDYLYRQLPMYQRVGPVAFKKDLTNTLALCEALGQPQERFPSIHLAGTNGKGSTSHLLAAFLQASGKKVGLYTSPHYNDFRERIKINGQLMPRRTVVRFVQRHRATFERIQPSFFEITVAMAFDYFAQQNVDVAVVETGLGGRLDSTNVLTPVLSVITNISLDHQQFLGDTLPQIATEKAGIIKRGVPVVIGETQAAVRTVFETTSTERQAPIVFADQHIRLTRVRPRLDRMLVDAIGDDFRINDLAVEVAGAYQLKNIVTALQSWRTLNERTLLWPIAEADLRRGWADLRSRTNFFGRWMVLGREPTVLADSGHNEAGIRQVLHQLSATTYDQLHFVLGVVNDKSIDKMLSMLPKSARYYFVKADIPRGLPAATLRDQAATFGLMGRAYQSVRRGLAAAKRSAQSSDLIFVGGSVFVVAEVL